MTRQDIRGYRFAGLCAAVAVAVFCQSLLAGLSVVAMVVAGCRLLRILSS
ncbi:hypothetical protein [Lentzea aerocolonigenes]|nr:hypothetical protein [Lentzea aerocolonigenes]MCP2248756.1 hypothetical protein [Lentzea aerocolonigenes]